MDQAKNYRPNSIGNNLVVFLPKVPPSRRLFPGISVFVIYLGTNLLM